ncbi:Z1 domain-containing protein [Nitrosospira sp. Nsp13]|uniref:Z1 domain-containing protein n=1 Tax=Nitrosospira sp. Nsp13 TaxID=1855332 RepID=UPI00087E24D5|nr:Z1 domain-containing protein [Nitrosospira sp. Nsp13]SCX93251.1 Z1 domain-containing protein [Nitrosospira sp. Nsp13]
MAEDEGKNLQGVISIAQTLLLKEKDKSSITTALIAEKVDLAVSLFAADSAVDRGAAIGELIRRFSLWIGQDSSMVDDEGHVPWLVSARKNEWRYWQRYQGWLERKMSATAVEGLGISTDKILGLLEDPLREGSWDRRGLVVGHVQSGKTGNYSGLVCKAADAGYKIIIVLAGLHNNLRSQTQIRLEEGFLGYETSAAGDCVKLIGVGEIDSDSKIQPNCATNRSNTGDFNTKVAQHYAISPEQRPWLFVVKKNKTVLERLLKWIRNHVADATDGTTGRRFVSNLPLLLIDDEADHASVDTGEQLFNADGTPDEEHQPKAINSRIRKILHSFAKSGYVGYTATPFANIFIHRRNETSDEGPDLFPQSFIINLAAPSNYVGPAKVFGLRSPEGRSGGLPLTRDVSDHIDREGLGGWMPPKHNKEHVPLCGGRDIVPPSLRKAVAAFALACAARVVRGQVSGHSSMLVHVTRLNLVQGIVHRQVDDIVKHMRQKITRSVDHESLLAELETLWREDFELTCAVIAESQVEDALRVPSWEEILAALPDVLSDIEVRMINGTAKDALDYAEQGRCLKVIAIGGDKLARGLTLEGLCVSYFVRTSKMYDTLMQMGRWFGYRPGYIDLCRLYTTKDLGEWFGHIADASEELREEFDAMAESGATPREYGLKVQSHPILMVTSPLKMRSAKNLQLSFSGELLETVAFYQTPAILKRNLDATDRLVSAMGAPSEIDPKRGRDGSEHEWKGFLWNGVPAETIADFFSFYVTHPKARKVNSALLTDFVRAMAAVGELTSWTVMLFGSGSGDKHVFRGGLKIDAMSKRKRDEDLKDRYSIGRLLSPKDEAVDFDAAAWKAAMLMTTRAWKPDPARQKDGVTPTPPMLPNGPSIRRIRGEGADGVAKAPQRGLLLLYPLDPTEAGLDDPMTPVMAFGVSFPTSASGTKVKYEVDHLLWENEYGPAD